MPPKSPDKPIQKQNLSSFFTGVPPLATPSTTTTSTTAKKGSSKTKVEPFYTVEVTKKGNSPSKASGSNSKKSDTTSKHFGSTSTSDLKPSSSTTTMNKSTTSSASTSKPKSKPTPDVMIISDSDDDEAIVPTLKSKAPLTKRKAVSSSEEEEEEEEEEKPKPKGKGRISVKAPKAGDKIVKKSSGSTTTKKVEKKVETEEEEDEDDEMNGGSKSKSKASTSAAVKRSPSKKPPAKKVKQESKDDDKEVEAKPKWVYKPKVGPSNPGGKAIPHGKENCLAGLTFVFTGEMSSFSRDEMQDMAKRFGGRVTTAPSSKTSYVVLGTEAGPSKLKMIEKHNLKTLDEDGFLDLIGKRPSGAEDPKFIEQKEKEEKKIKDEAKKMVLGKDAPEHKQQLWTDKYAPAKLAEICGNKGSVEKLSKWLELWPKSLASDFKKPGPDAMGGFRCVLISGPPGIGKTTAAHLVAKLQGYNILELNASDVRSKKLLETAFQTTINNTTLSGFFKSTGDNDDQAEPSVNQKSVIIMDEVDGMSAGDRGGVGALNALIRKTRVPIIAICNDKSSVKMKPLANTCFQMIFKRASAAEIRGRMMTVCFKEGIKMEGSVIDQLVSGSQSDIRSIINMLSTWKLSEKTMDFDQGKKLARASAKNSIATPWTLYGKLMAPQAFSSVSGMTLNDKLDLYFQDHSMMPLFVQQNYLTGGSYSKAANMTGPDAVLKKLELASKAADAISDGDLVDGLIHGGQQWSLMPVHGIFSCIRPAYFCHGPSNGFASFSAWFGKNSTQGKLQRFLGEIQIRMRLRVSGDRKEIRSNYIPTLWPRLVLPLQHPDAGAEAIEEVIALMDEYFLSKEDWEAIIELGVGEGFQQEAVLKKIDTKVKAAFTRKYNSTDHPVPFAPHMEGGKVAKKIAGGPAPDQEDVMLEDAEESEDEATNSADDADLTKDKMVIQKKAKKGKGKAVASKKK